MLPPPLMLHNFLLKHFINYHNLHLSFKGNCVTRGGGAALYKKKLKSVYILSKKCPDLQYWYLLCKYSPDTQNFDVFFTSWMQSIIKMWKLTKMLGRVVRLIFILPLSKQFEGIAKFFVCEILWENVDFYLWKNKRYYCISFVCSSSKANCCLFNRASGFWSLCLWQKYC